MMDEMANHGNRIRSYMERYGEETVENFIDSCLSLENLIDIYSPLIKRRDAINRYDFAANEEEQDEQRHEVPEQGLHGRVHQPAPGSQGRGPQAGNRTEKEKAKSQSFPEQPERDVLLFLLEHAPLKPWQHDVLAIIREEAYYFAPQGQTKIMNEGWASFWHSTIMTQKTLHPSELVDYADHHSGTMATQPGRLNPYKLGHRAAARHRGALEQGAVRPGMGGMRQPTTTRQKWDKQLGLGRQKIFEVRRIHNDVTFIDTFLTVDFCRRHQLFSYRHNDQTEMYEIESREFKKIKERLLFNLTNFGQPIIRVKDGNYRNRGELYLQHEYFGVDLKLDHAQDTLRHLHRLWTRPVHIETVVDGRPTLLSFDGTDHSIRPLGGSSHESEQKDRRRA